MREVSGTTWSFQMIILFILIFAAFLTLVLNYSKAYSVKNEFLSIVEKYDGVTPESVGILDSYLNANSYRTKGKCPTNDENEIWYGAPLLDGSAPEEANSNTSYYYCYNVQNISENQIYYNVIVFYRFNLPVIGEIATYKIKGRTNSIVGANNRIGE